MRVRTEYLPAAIEINSSSLKLLQLGRINGSYKIIKAAYSSLPQNKGNPGPEIKKALESLVKENEVKGEVVTSLALNKINISTFVLPNMPSSEIEPALLWKVRQNLASGVNFDDISFDYVCNPVKEESKYIYALVFMVAKPITLDMVKLFKESSLGLIATEPKPYAVIEALSLLKKISEEETVLVLQLGAGSSSIAIVSGGHPYLITPLSVSGNGFTEAVANCFQLDWEKAEALKIKEGLGECPALSSQVESLILDMEHTFKYFSHQLVKSKVSDLDRVILCGGSSSLKNLDKFLNQKLGVPVVVFDPVDFFVSRSEPEVSPLIKTHSTAFASTLGLAARFVEDGGLEGEVKTG